jgi:predicted PurR-regulated permease PerM
MNLKSIKIVIFVTVAMALVLIVSMVFSNIVSYFLISLVIATILRPLSTRINNIQFYGNSLPRAFTALLSMLVFIAVLSSFIIIFIPLISEQVRVLSGVEYDLLYQKISGPLSSIEAFLIENRIVNQDSGFLVQNIRTSILDFLGTVEVGVVINNLVTLAGSLFIGILAVVFITFFLLYEKGLIKRQILSLVPNAYFELSIATLHKIEKLLSNYLLGLLFQMFSIFSLAALGLSIMGVKYALTIALFAALANLIPYAGPLLGATFGIIVGISTNLSMTSGNEYLFLILKIGIVFTIVQMVDNLILQPVIFSKSVKAHPLEIFVIIFAGGSLAGVIGMIAAIPVYTIVRVSVIELNKGFKEYQIFRN